MRNLVLLAGLSCVCSVRLDVTDEFKVEPINVAAAAANAINAESVDSVEDDPSKVVITAGFEKCRVLVTSDSTFSHFKKDLRIITETMYSYDLKADWLMHAVPRGAGSFQDSIYYPKWDDDDAKFNFHLTQYDTEKTHVMGHFVGLPARRVYIIVIGTVEHSRDSDRKEDEWKPKYACSGDTRISPKYLIDIFKTGDDLTKHVQTDSQLLDYQAFGNEHSTIHARKTDIEIDGKLLSILSKTSDRKAFWIRDATYIDYLDKQLFAGATNAAGVTFWGALADCRDDTSKQNGFFSIAGKMPIIEKVENVTNVEKVVVGPFFGEHAWDSDSDLSMQQLPVVVCGLFGKVWPNKGCRKAKSESEARR